MSVVAAVERDLAEIRKRDERLADSGLAASALSLAAEMDDATNSATSKSMCARALHDALDSLRALAPPAEEKDRLDDIAEQRAKRRARSAAATN